MNQLDPGVYEDLSFEDYAALPYLNQSVLKQIEPFDGGSPKHAKAAFDGLLRRDSDALKMGRAEHCMIVEGPEEFAKRYEVSETCGALLKSGKNAGMPCGQTASFRDGEHWVCGMHKTPTTVSATDYVTREDFVRINAMADSVKGHPIIQHLRRPGWSECTIVYDVSVKGATLDKSGEPKTVYIDATLRHKCRIDRLAKPKGNRPHLIVDLKRMQVGAGSAAERSRVIERYGWDVQAAMYCEAVRKAFDVSACEWIWIFVEEGPPYDVQVIPADEDTLLIGLDKLTRYRALWAECQAKNDWPGQCAAAPSYGGLSEWAVKEYRRKFGIDGKLMVEA